MIAGWFSRLRSFADKVTWLLMLTSAVAIAFDPGSCETTTATVGLPELKALTL